MPHQSLWCDFKFQWQLTKKKYMTKCAIECKACKTIQSLQNEFSVCSVHGYLE